MIGYPSKHSIGGSYWFHPGESLLAVTTIDARIWPLARLFFTRWAEGPNGSIPFLIFVNEQGMPADYRSHLPINCHIQIVAKRGNDPLNIGPKMCVYSAHQFVRARRYLLIDVDMIVQDSVYDICLFGTGALIDDRIAIYTPEMDNPEDRTLQDLFYEMFGEFGIYHGVEADWKKYFKGWDGKSPQGHNTPINTGFLVLSSHVMVDLEHFFNFVEPEIYQWVYAPARNSHDYTGHREQALVNYVLLQMKRANRLELASPGEKYNYQAMHRKMALMKNFELFDPENVGVRIPVVHLNGWSNPDGPSAKVIKRFGPDLGMTAKEIEALYPKIQT